MYVGQYEPVEIPKNGRLHIQKSGYVYWSNISKWDNEKKRSVDNRIPIGKIIQEQPGMMYPNKKYFDIFGKEFNNKEKENMEMEHRIRDLNIENFRGIHKIHISDMRRLVLLTGKNNVGKSSVLEAIFFMMDYLSPDSFCHMNGFRGLNSQAKDVNLWEPLFYQMNPSNTIKIQITQHNDTITLLCGKDNQYIPALNGGVPKTVATSFQSSAKKYYTIRFNYRIEGSVEYNETCHYSVSESGILREVSADDVNQQIPQLTCTTFVNNSFARTDLAILDRMGKAEMRGEKDRLIGYLQQIDKSISDIVTLSINGISQLYVKTNNKLLPIQFSGDGINKLLYIVLCIMEAKDGILLIDEIDTGFHYTMYKDLWKIISNVSREYNCQIIATTHSYENIVGAIEGVKEYPEDFSYFRLGYGKDGLQAFRSSYDLLKSAVRSAMEVR